MSEVGEEKERRWYEEVLGARREQLVELRAKASVEEREQIDISINYIDQLCHPNYVYYSPAESLDEESIWFGSVKDYLPQLMSLASTDVTIPYRYYPSKSLSDEEVYELVHDFYKDMTDKEIFKIFRGIFKKRDKIIYKDRLMEVNPAPTTIYLPYKKQIFMRFKRKKTCDDLLDLAHEYGHCIQFLMNFHPSFYKDKVIFSEVVSIFFELLAMEYFKQVPEFSDYFQISRMAILDDLSTKSDMTLFEADVLHIWARKELSVRKRLDTIRTLIFDSYPFPFPIDYIVEMNNRESFVYSFSYLLAVELLSTYLSDKEYGLYQLKEYINLSLKQSREGYYKSIQSLGISPNEHFDEYKRHVLNKS